MYLKHFAMTRFPFDSTLAAGELFDAGAQGEAEIRLRHLLDLRGIGLLTGEPGSGKATLSRRVVDGLHPGLFRTVYITLSTGNVMDMYVRQESSEGGSVRRVSRPRELPPRPLSEPGVNLSIHRAPIVPTANAPRPFQ